ncbi:unnamed protein product [Caenorhabditis sp. 36 PRJEB53466]|nr:unnamed protein product [Caenorhabditis sp. 36 PRJEB53466]
MGTSRETVKPSKGAVKPTKTPGGLSFRNKMKKNEGVGATLNEANSKTKKEMSTDKPTTGTTGRTAGKSMRRKMPEKSVKKKNVPKEIQKYAFANGEIVEGVNQYKVASQIRKSLKPLELDVYIVKDVEQDDELRMKVGNQDLRVLKTEAALLRRLEKKPGDRCFLSMSEYGSVAKNKVEFLIVSPYGMTLYDIMKKSTYGPFSVDCAFAVGIQMLKAIKDLHSIGYLHRNIRPSAFTCGLGEEEASVYLQDFRAVRKYEEQKKHVNPRTTVKKYGALRFCSRSCQKEKDQGRKDDLESWLYTLFYLMDNNSLSWKKETNPESVFTGKEAFMHAEGQEQFAKAPRALAPAIAVIFAYEFASEPDYDTIKKVLVDIQTEQKMNEKACDWRGKTGLNEIEGDTNRSPDCKVTGERDVALKAKASKKKTSRKKLSSGDIIQCQGATNGWKVINLLGSGGFGDVYKVHKENQPPTKAYALKTESEDGEKRYLRLKVEVMVMMKTAEKKKESKFEHFIEFVDRGKCEELKCKFVVMGLVGPSLEDIRRKYLLASFSKHTAFNVAIQTVQAVKDLHSIGYLHRDIKPANYAVGLAESEGTVYMLDFGIAKLFLDESGNHKIKRKKVKFLGTLRYACRACMLQQEQGRRDDLETWLYLVFDIMDESNGMPWRKLTDPKEILKSKEKFFTAFQSLPFNSNLKKLKDVVQYVDTLKYEACPDYDYIITFLAKTAADVNAKVTKKLDWIGKLSKKEFDSDSDKSDKKQSGDEEEGGQ